MIYSHHFNVLTRTPKRGRPKNKLWLGVELEFETIGLVKTENYLESSRSFHARGLLNGFGKFLTPKDDSTIIFGYELVSAPATLRIHQAEWPKVWAWEGFKNYSASQYCGLHVHVSRSAFLESDMLYFFHYFINSKDNHELIVDLAGRESERWCRKYEKPKDRVVMCNYAIDTRYEAVNTLNKKTLEVRIFASTTKLELFLSRLEFVDAVANWVTSDRTLTVKVLREQEFARFVETHKKKYEHFWNWLTHYFAKKVAH